MEWPVGCPSGHNGSRLELVTFDSRVCQPGQLLGDAHWMSWEGHPQDVMVLHHDPCPSQRQAGNRGKQGHRCLSFGAPYIRG